MSIAVPGQVHSEEGVHLDQNHAGQIANLLNTRNQLVKNYDAKAILAARAIPVRGS